MTSGGDGGGVDVLEKLFGDSAQKENIPPRNEFHQVARLPLGKKFLH